MTPNNRARDLRRQAERLALRAKRPRCMICSKPIDYNRSGVTRATVTCSQRCARVRWNWFVRAPRGR